MRSLNVGGAGFGHRAAARSLNPWALAADWPIDMSTGDAQILLANEQAATGRPWLDAALRTAGLSPDEPPTASQWRAFLAAAGTEQVYTNEQWGVDGWSSYRNLFQASPTATFQQDYSHLEEWMRSLRASGVTDITRYLGDDVERIRHHAPLIHINAINPAAARIVGVSEEEAIGPIDPRIINEGSLPGWVSQFDAVWNGTPLSEAVFEAQSLDGRVYDARSTLAAPVVGGRPDFSRAILTIVDITDLRLEERRMAALVEAKDKFLATVSHEIRTPLTSVLGFARILEQPDETLTDDDRRLMLAAIAEQAQDVANLVDDLLVASRAEIGRLNVQEIGFDVSKEIAAATDRLVSSEPATVALGDPARFRQIVRNLVTNAERYGGPDIRVGVACSDSMVRVEVSDDGSGIPAGVGDAIFDPYRTAHEIAGKPGSMGIGLSIARHLARLMHGDLGYRREDNRTVFRLTLRQAPTPRPDPPGRQPARSVNRSASSS